MEIKSTLGFHNLHHRSLRIQNWGLYFLDPVRGVRRIDTADGRNPACINT